ncbi:LAFE_0E01244g1_1 [Lachancea fermentati]|uniref:Mitochondrial distribution and morphology protein 12 n=1 Tax=Lachancea fermentati TaxID=4955 RepID=A0A1G4MCL6_LACFM|nr:LAFE_0E01244g1_1 [Lachancea fermentati]
MSFEVNWENLGKDRVINDSIKGFINSHLQSIILPSYVSSLQVTDFSLGNIAPKITLKEISNPLQEFYDHIAEDVVQTYASEQTVDGTVEGFSNNVIDDKQSDAQFLLEIDYKGDMLIEVKAELVLNYPSNSFMTLPVKLAISDIGIHALCLIAYLSKQLFISFLCDVSDPILDAHDSIVDSTGTSFLGKQSLERISLIRSIKINSEIGEQNDGEGSILRSVGKLEQFLLEVFRNILRKEAAWPSWINLDFNDDDEDNEDDEDGDGTDLKQPDTNEAEAQL